MAAGDAGFRKKIGVLLLHLDPPALCWLCVDIETHTDFSIGGAALCPVIHALINSATSSVAYMCTRRPWIRRGSSLKCPRLRAIANALADLNFKATRTSADVINAPNCCTSASVISDASVVVCVCC